MASIEISYRGYGDSGATDGVQYRGPTGIRVDRSTIAAPLSEDLERCAYSFLPAGLAINDSGQGKLTIDVRAGKVTIQHQESYTESRDSTREVTL